MGISNGDYGERVWDEKIKRQGEVGVIFGNTSSFKDVISETKNFLNKMEKLVFPLIKEGGKIADLGVGPMARFSREFTKRGYEVTGIDISSKTLEKANKYIKKDRLEIKLIKDDLVSLKKIEDKFDMAFCRATFYHIPLHLTGISLMNVWGLLKKEGIFIVEFGINEKRPILKIINDFFYWVGHYIKSIFGRGFRVNVSRFERKEIEELIEKSGFKKIGMVDKTTYILRKVE